MDNDDLILLGLLVGIILIISTPFLYNNIRERIRVRRSSREPIEEYKGVVLDKRKELTRGGSFGINPIIILPAILMTMIGMKLKSIHQHMEKLSLATE